MNSNVYPASYLYHLLNCSVVREPAKEKLGDFTEVIQALKDVHVGGGREAVARAVETLSEQHPALSELMSIISPWPRSTYHLTDLKNLPRAKTLRGIVPANQLAVLYGPPGIGKTFVALAMVLSLSLEDSVLYITAEGAEGMDMRANAWSNTFNTPSEELNIYFEHDVVNLLDPQKVEYLKQKYASLQPQTIVIDTLARTMLGGDENSTGDMGEYVAAVDSLRREFGATAIVIHHSNKYSSKTERGSSALRGAADVMWSLTEKEGILTLTVEKDKHRKKAAPRKLVLKPVETEAGESLVAVKYNGKDKPTSSDQELKLITILEALNMELHQKNGLVIPDIATITEIPAKSLYRYVDKLFKDGFVIKKKEGRTHLYAITETGQQHLTDYEAELSIDAEDDSDNPYAIIDL